MSKFIVSKHKTRISKPKLIISKFQMVLKFYLKNFYEEETLN